MHYLETAFLLLRFLSLIRRVLSIVFCFMEVIRRFGIDMNEFIMWLCGKNNTLHLNQRGSLRFSENSLNFSQYRTTEKNHWCYIH